MSAFPPQRPPVQSDQIMEGLPCTRGDARVPADAEYCISPAAASNEGGTLLPRYRILAYYGHPRVTAMGILGQHDPGRLFANLRDLAALYEDADPTRRVLPAFQLIAAVAQRDSGRDGTYRMRTDASVLDAYTDFTACHDVLLILDLQIGRSPLEEEIEAVRPWLERPHVHLALDPEWSMAEGEIPGSQIGRLDASSITWTQRILAAIVAEVGLPPKVLVVHQFRQQMIPHKVALKPIPGVQLVIDADGFGDPILKTEVYNVLVRDQLIEFGGIKLFYRQDRPLLTPDQVLALTPPPDLVIYQ